MIDLRRRRSKRQQLKMAFQPLEERRLLAALTLSFAQSSVAETQGTVTGTVTRAVDDGSTMNVFLSVFSNQYEVDLPETVVLFPGQTSVDFLVDINDDVFADGDKDVLIGASNNVDFTSTVLNVVDDEPFGMIFQFVDDSIREGENGLAGIGLLAPLENDLLLSFSTNFGDTYYLPPDLNIPAGSTGTVFNYSRGLNNVLEGDQLVTFSADPSASEGRAGTLPIATDEILLIDWTPPEFSIESNVAQLVEGESATVTITAEYTPLVDQVFTVSADPSQLNVPATVVLPAGESTVTFIATAVDDDIEEADAHSTIFASMDSMQATVGIVDEEVSIFVIDDDAVPAIDSVTIGDGTSQRSMITSVTANFNTQVELDESSGSAFELHNRDTGEVVQLVATSINGGTSYQLTFLAGDSAYARADGSVALEDGNYELRIVASRVSSVYGVGLGGGDFVFGDEEIDGFFRLFGDTDGDRDVDGQDYGRFGATFFRVEGMAGFNSALDYDGDGDVDGRDYGQFGARFLRYLGF